jgi:hypothetical protein
VRGLRIRHSACSEGSPSAERVEYTERTMEAAATRRSLLRLLTTWRLVWILAPLLVVGTLLAQTRGGSTTHCARSTRGDTTRSTRFSLVRQMPARWRFARER